MIKNKKKLVLFYIEISYALDPYISYFVVPKFDIKKSTKRIVRFIIWFFNSNTVINITSYFCNCNISSGVLNVYVGVIVSIVVAPHKAYPKSTPAAVAA